MLTQKKGEKKNTHSHTHTHTHSHKHTQTNTHIHTHTCTHSMVADLQAQAAEFEVAKRQMQQQYSDLQDVRDSLLRKLNAQAATIRELRDSINAVCFRLRCAVCVCVCVCDYVCKSVHIRNYCYFSFIKIPPPPPPMQMSEQNQKLIGQNQKLRSGGTVMSPAAKPVGVPVSDLTPQELDQIQDEVCGA